MKLKIEKVEIAKLHLEKNDVIVLKIKGEAASKELEEIIIKAKPYFPNNKVIALNNNIDIEVVKQEN